MTVVAADATWTEVGAETATGGDGAAVTAVPAPGSVFTVAAEHNRNTGLKDQRWYSKVKVSVPHAVKQVLSIQDHRATYKAKQSKMEAGRKRMRGERVEWG